MPGAGAMVSGISYTLDDLSGGRSRDSFKPEVIGKPNPYVIELIKREHNITDTSK